jgi:hypothetical protein
MTTRVLAVAAVLALATPAVTSVQAQVAGSPAYSEGLNRGLRAGEEDSRRGDAYNFTDENDYRRADAGYRSQYGYIERYKDDFRRGYEVGYRSGYTRNTNSRVPPYYDPQYPDPRYPDPRYSDPRYPDPRYDNRSGTAVRRDDLALTNGYNDGYERGLDDGHDRRRKDPVAERYYRGGDRGYEKWYGPKELYKTRYREAFRNGYERGYDDARRYTNGGRPWWWPF